MTKQEVYAITAAILTTLLEVHPNPAPESSIYLAMGMDINKYGLFRDLLTGNKLVEVKHHGMTLTDKGLELARECEAVIS